MVHRRNGQFIVYMIMLIFLWGLTWPILKIGLYYAPPILYAGIRTLIGGLILSVVALPKWRKIQLRKLWHIYLISAIFNVILYFGLQNLALSHLSSGLLSVLVYLQPILVGFLAWIWLKEPLSVSKITGLIAGFLGVILISGKGIMGGVSILGIVLALLTAISWAIGTVYWKYIQGRVEPLWIVAIPFSMGGAVLTIFGILTEHWTSIRWMPPLFTSLFYTSLLGTALAWLLWFRLVNMGEVSMVSTFTFFVPILSVSIGVAWLHEQINFAFIIGFLAIVCGIYLVNRKPSVKAHKKVSINQ